MTILPLPLKVRLLMACGSCAEGDHAHCTTAPTEVCACGWHKHRALWVFDYIEP